MLLKTLFQERWNKKRGKWIAAFAPSPSVFFIIMKKLGNPLLCLRGGSFKKITFFVIKRGQKYGQYLTEKIDNELGKLLLLR